MKFWENTGVDDTHLHMWLHCNYTRKLALTKRTRFNITQPTHVDMRRAS